ncbi:MAG: DUF2291 domain-containing protein [Anaerolineales bacterium]|nr:DUF2291 domain-containing protein [Anaerolineales bacterium]
MTRKNKISVLLLILAIPLLFACTVVPIDEKGNPIGVGDMFDAASLVAQIWDTQVIPTFKEKSLPIEQIIDALEKDPQKAREQYGRQAAVGGPYTFMVKGEGKVIDIEASNLLVDLNPYDGREDLFINIGPVYTGTEVRDALDFIRFKDFRDITQYAAVAKELNKKVREEVVSIVDRDNIIGKTIVFFGAFGLKETNKIILIPVILEIR